MTIPSGPYIPQPYNANSLPLKDQSDGTSVALTIDSGDLFVGGAELAKIEDLSSYVQTSAMQAALTAKQDTLVSGTNIKTVNSTSLLGSGNIVISGGSLTITEVDGSPSVSASTIKFPNGSLTDNGSGVVTIAAVLGSFTKAQLDTAISDGNAVYVGDALNGSLGATTPSTVAATTITASSTVGVLQTSPLAPIHVGSRNVINSVDAQVLISRTINTGSGNGHAFSDSSDWARAGTLPAYNSFDARITTSGSNTSDHYAGFQANPTFGGTSITNMFYGLFVGPTINTGAGVPQSYGVYVANTVGSGTISNAQYGVYVESLTKGAANYAIYTAGTTQSYFGGSVTILGDIPLSGGSRIYAAGDFKVGRWLYWPTGTTVNSTVDGVLVLRDNAFSSFNRIQFGGTTSSYASLKRNATALESRLADDSGYAPFNASIITASNSLITATSTPASATAAGTAGTITWDANFLYVCTATNVWKRVAIATW